MTGTAFVDLRSVAVCQGKGSIPVRVSGNGPPVLYLHSEIGLTWDNFLADLAANHRVYAPHFPGTAEGDADAIHQYDDLLDVVLAYEEIVRALGIEGAVVVGHSFGGMLAAELAAVFPDLFSGVVLIDAFGLWSNTDPTSSDLMAGPYERLPEVLFHDPHCPAAQSMRISSVDAADALDRAAACIWAVGCTAKFLWPIPERGLAKRLHRITAPTLIVWGAQDAVVPAHYAFRFADHIAPSRTQIIDSCGHIPQLEQEAQTIAAVEAFLAETVRVRNPLKTGG
jgi:pimeloyl-ACP methyl ester carboxylesterase